MKNFYVATLCLCFFIALTATLFSVSAKADGECDPKNFMGTSFMC